MVWEWGWDGDGDGDGDGDVIGTVKNAAGTVDSDMLKKNYLIYFTCHHKLITF